MGSHHFDDWNAKHLGDLDFRQLKAKLAALPDNLKTFNNIASLLKLVSEYGDKARLVRELPHDSVDMRRLQKPKPDPLTLAEADLAIAKVRDPRGVNFYEFALFTGLKPNEQIALRWTHIDLRAGTATIQMARTRAKAKTTKTGEERTVELNALARAAIERQRAVSQLVGEQVFVGIDNQPYTTTDGPLEAWWKPAMKLSGLRHRDARQTRQTYATLCLHASLTPAWVAKQLGHSVEMCYRVYSKWIEGADMGAETRKLDAFIERKV